MIASMQLAVRIGLLCAFYRGSHQLLSSVTSCRAVHLMALLTTLSAAIIQASIDWYM